MDTQQQRETHQVRLIQNLSGDELEKQTWLQRRRRLIVWLHWNNEEGFGMLSEMDLKEKLKKKSVWIFSTM